MQNESITGVHLCSTTTRMWRAENCSGLTHKPLLIHPWTGFKCVSVQKKYSENPCFLITRTSLINVTGSCMFRRLTHSGPWPFVYTCTCIYTVLESGSSVLCTIHFEYYHYSLLEMVAGMLELALAMGVFLSIPVNWRCVCVCECVCVSVYACACVCVCVCVLNQTESMIVKYATTTLYLYM